MTRDQVPNEPSLNISGESGANIDYRDAGGNLIWQIPVHTVVLVAEYTNPYGPQADDYFLIFVFVKQGQCYFRTATFYAAGAEESLQVLSALWHEPLRFGLCDSTDWKSRVIWPKELVDQEYFTFTEITPRSLLERLSRLCSGVVHEYSPSATVKGYCEGVLREHPAGGLR